MSMEFNGAALRLARLFGGMTLEDVALKIGKSRQYLHKLETAQSPPTAQLLVELAAALKVAPDFFYGNRLGTLAEDQVQFRKLAGTRVGIKQIAIARAEFTGLLVASLERRVKLPAVRLPSFGDVKSIEDVEQAAEHEKGERKGQRLATNKDEAVAWFERYFAYVARSEFLTGSSSDWACDLGWLVNSANFEKVLAGNYENKLKVVA